MALQSPGRSHANLAVLPELFRIKPTSAFEQIRISSSSAYSKVITHHASIVLKVQVDPIRPPPGLALPNHYSRHDFFSKLRLALFDRSHHHITDTGSGKTVKTGTDAFYGDDVEISCAGVVAAVHDSTTEEDVSV